MTILWWSSSLLLGFSTSGTRAFRVRRGVFVQVEQINLETIYSSHSKVKIWSFLFEFIFTNYFSHCVKKSIEKMAEESQSTVKFLNPHPMKIDEVVWWHEQFWDMEVWGDRYIDGIKPWRHSTIKRKARGDFWKRLG